jgi:hypothetical protein
MTRLAREVQEAIAADPMYGPQYDKERHMVGVEYEVVLEQTLLEMGKSYHAGCTVSSMVIELTSGIHHQVAE